jgi:hypothetical protein
MTSFIAEISFAGRDRFWVGPITAADPMDARVEFVRTFRETFPELPAITRIERGDIAVFIHRPGQPLIANRPITLAMEPNNAA